MLAAPVLAHQGGWDEILMVVAPLALFWLLLRAANRRHADTHHTHHTHHTHDAPDTHDPRA